MPGPGFSGALNELTRAGSSCDRGKPKAVMKPYLRRLAQTFSPEFYSWYQAYRFRQWVRSSYGGAPRPILLPFFLNRKPFLFTGPFQGMPSLAETRLGVLPPNYHPPPVLYVAYQIYK